MYWLYDNLRIIDDIWRSIQSILVRSSSFHARTAIWTKPAGSRKLAFCYLFRFLFFAHLLVLQTFTAHPTKTHCRPFPRETVTFQAYNALMFRICVSFFQPQVFLFLNCRFAFWGSAAVLKSTHFQAGFHCGHGCNGRGGWWSAWWLFHPIWWPKSLLWSC